MAEIGIDDLPAATRARFVDDDAAQAALDAVLAAARHHCGWHVSPVKTGDVLTLDGPGVSVLDLPTGKLNALTSVTEDETALDVTKLTWSGRGLVRKKSGARWSCHYRSIVATITHGFTEAEAADWRRAIVAMVDAVSQSLTAEAETSGALKRKKVDDTEYEWSDQDFAESASQAVYSVSAVLDQYRCETVLFA